MKMNRIYVGLAAGVLVMAGATTSSKAATIDENFESYGITGAPDGSGTYGSFLDQNSHWRTNGGVTNKIVKDDTVGNGTQVLQLTNTDNSTRYVSSQNNDFDAVDGQVKVTTDVLLPGSGTTMIVFSDRDNAINTFYVRLSTTLGVEVHVGDSQGDNAAWTRIKDEQNNNVASLATDHWYHFDATLHVDPTGNNDTFDLTVTDLTNGGALIGSLSGHMEGNPAAIANVHLYVNNTGTVARFDNVSYKAVPEPASGSLLLLGVGGLLMRRRK